MKYVYLIDREPNGTVGRYLRHMRAFDDLSIAYITAIQLLAEYPIVETPDGGKNNPYEYVEKQIEQWNEADLYGIAPERNVMDRITFRRLRVE